jgi:hypothetical protein
MRWGRLKRRAMSRVKVTLFERQARPSCHRWVLIRDRDGRAWAGPHRWQGQTFTEAERFWYLFANVESANAAIIGSGFVGVSVRQIV